MVLFKTLGRGEKKKDFTSYLSAIFVHLATGATYMTML